MHSLTDFVIKPCIEEFCAQGSTSNQLVADWHKLVDSKRKNTPFQQLGMIKTK